MGKDWLYWIVGGGGGGNAKSAAVRRREMTEEMKEAAATSSGCMCAVFQIFDCHTFQLPVVQNNHSSSFHSVSTFSQEEDEGASSIIKSKGVEAASNSVEYEEAAAMNVFSKSTAKKEKDNSLIFPVGIQIKTSDDKPCSSSSSSSSPRISTTKSRPDHSQELSSEISSNSSTPRTPSIVARLMGLDLLPSHQCTTNNSPKSSNSRPHPIRSHSYNHRKDLNILRTRSNNVCFFDDDISVGARSLPGTPRLSSARMSDVEYNHRLSLQINKENIAHEELFGVASAKSTARSRSKLRNIVSSGQDETRSPGNYARQIVKQVKERVSRRVGLIDITNNPMRKNKIEESTSRRDENLTLSKRKDTNERICNDGKQSRSPRLSFLETTTKNNSKSCSKSTRMPSSSLEQQEIVKPSKPKSQVINTPSSKKNGNKPRACVRNKKKEEAFVHRSLMEKKSKKSPLSSELLNISGPTLLPVKKDPSPPATKLPQKQSQVSDAVSSKKSTQLSCKPSHSYKQLQLHPEKPFALPENVTPDNGNGCATTSSAGAAAEYEHYIQRILKRAGITEGFNPLTLAKWYTPSQPLDPAIFYYLELFHPTTSAAAGGDVGASVLSRRCNRKLIFQLVDELLSEILRTHLSFRTKASLVAPDRPPPLADELCKKIQSFPAANCQVLEDIDALIDTDFCKTYLKSGLEEERERFVNEIEGEIIEELVRETVATAVPRWWEPARRRNRDRG